MIKNLYCIYDDKAVLYSEPFTAVNDDIAKRNFLSLVWNNPFYSDYVLMRQGVVFDDSCGMVCDSESVLLLGEVTISDEEFNSYRDTMLKHTGALDNIKASKIPLKERSNG